MGRSNTIRHWSDEEVARLKELKIKKVSNTAIAEEFGRFLLSINQRVSKLRKANEMAPYDVNVPTAKRQYIKKDKTAITHQLAPAKEHHMPVARPMIALVGTPSEVTQTIRELFS